MKLSGPLMNMASLSVGATAAELPALIRKCFYHPICLAFFRQPSVLTTATKQLTIIMIIIIAMTTFMVLSS